MINNYFNKTYKIINKTFTSLNNLNLVTKLFVTFLILLIMTCVFDSFKNVSEINSLENFSNNTNDEKYEKKIDNKAYDRFYSKYYDAIFLNKKRYELELKHITSIEKKNRATKILDVGCGTGYTVKLFHDKAYDIIGLDQSEDMISKAQSNYPKCEFITNNILTSNIFDFDNFTHILCLGKTIYEIKDKVSFFDNCISLLSKDGYLIINLVNRNLFKPYVQNKDKDTLYDPQEYGKKVSELIVKFDKNNEFESKYKVKKHKENIAKEIDAVDNTAIPYAVYNEKFTNYKLHTIRENEFNLYMPETKKILNLAKSKDLKLLKKFDLSSSGHSDEYLYVFKKL
jgi:2-polyprenyl-3-methyl-5-hydroxy-6-metoxy-1,4-benzoquinol methylase